MSRKRTCGQIMIGELRSSDRKEATRTDGSSVFGFVAPKM